MKKVYTDDPNDGQVTDDPNIGKDTPPWEKGTRSPRAFISDNWPLLLFGAVIVVAVLFNIFN